MIRKLKPIVNIILMFALVMCWGLTIGYSENIKPSREVINFFFEESNVTTSKVKELKEIKKDVDIVGWREDSLQTVINPDLSRTASELKVLLIKGDSSLILNSVFLFEDDKQGCLIDEDTAYKLFGSKNAIGRELQFSDRTLVVRGIHKETKANLILQLLDDEEVKLDGISLDGSKFTLTEMKDFKMQSGLQELPIKGGIYYTVSKMMSMIIPIIILILLLSKVGINLLKERRKPVLFIIYLAVAFAIIIIFFKITNIKIQIPLDMIPNKWSDFDFWGELWDEFTKKIEYVIYMKKYGVDIYNIENLFKTLFYSILSIVLFIVNLKLVKINDIKYLLGFIGILIVSTFIVVITINIKYGFDINIPILWLSYPLYLCGNQLIIQLNKLKIIRPMINIE